MNNNSNSVYSDLKVFHYSEFLDNLHNATGYPLHIRLKPTNKCNHNCYYCAYRNPNQTIGADMDTVDEIPYEKMVEVIQDIIEMGVKAVTFSGGGEPTIYPYLDKAIELLSESPVRFSLITNGSLFSGKIADLFSRFGSWVRVSIDGWDSVSYKAYRGVGDFDKVISNIYNFKSDKCSLGISIIVTEENADHIHDIVLKLSDANIRSIKISPCVIGDDSGKNADYHKKISETVNRQLQWIREDFDIPVNYAYHEQLNSFQKEYVWCPTMQVKTIIGADQNIYTCQDKAYEQSGFLGSFKDMRFREAWDIAHKFKINPNRDCSHHCMAHNKNKLMLEYLKVNHKEFV